MKLWIKILSLMLAASVNTNVLAANYKYRIWLIDKAQSTYSTERPEEFLSSQSIERRNRYGIPVDYRDLPVSTYYIEDLKTMGCTVEVTSKWMNTVVINIDDTTMIADITALPYVDKAECIWRHNSIKSNRRHYKPIKNSTQKKHSSTTYLSQFYNHTWQQTQLLHLDSLHAAGFRGEGMVIAVLDAGFYQADQSEYIEANKIIGYHDFAHSSNIYDTHGTEVFSCMAGYVEGEFVGSAPDAKYWLISTENLDSEYPIEEDYWVAGAELADSVGADIINSSLAYTTFDDPAMNYTHDELDGETGFCSRAATIASEKGMLVVVAAGNEYSREWKKIGVPGDAKGCITVGSVDSSGTHSKFSSCGYTADNRIKPDIMSMGSNVSCITANNRIKTGSGTSYACPIVCGALACLWQAHREWSVTELIERVQNSCSQYEFPDKLYGYGIPNIYAAYCGTDGVESVTSTPSSMYVFNGSLHLPHLPQQASITLFDTAGNEIWHTKVDANCSSITLPPIGQGCYIATIQLPYRYLTNKIIIY